MDVDCVPLRDPRQQVKIADHQIGFRGHPYSASVLQSEHAENAAGHLKTALGGLIWIGCGSDPERFPTWHTSQFPAKRGGIELFGENACFEQHRIAQLHEFVRIPCVAIAAAELAATIRVDGPDRVHAPAKALTGEFSCLDLEVFDPPLGLNDGALRGHSRNAHKPGSARLRPQ